MAQVVLEEVTKRFGNVVAVNQVSLSIADGEFVVLVGPSGCGKTTTLNLVAGLIDLSSGSIYVDDRLINNLDPKDRDIAMVFQNYALYPAKTVYDNLAFPLQMRRTPKSEIDARIQEAAGILGLKELLNRRPRELSGGQQQRVALGRALVRKPRAFLMDEPLSNLDAKLRVQMRAELKRLHRDLGATVIYVTHDQMEAMTMADRIAILKDGIVQQYGSPEEVYGNPVNMFVAGFMGSPSMNLLSGQLLSVDGRTVVQGIDGWQIELSTENSRLGMAGGRDVVVGVRHGGVKLYHEAQPGSLQAQIYTLEPTGDSTFVHIRLGGDLIVASVEPGFEGAADEPIWVEFDQQRMHLFDGQSQMSLRRM